MGRIVALIASFAAASGQSEVNYVRKKFLFWALIGVFGLTVYAGILVWFGIWLAQVYSTEIAVALITAAAFAVAVVLAVALSIITRAQERKRHRRKEQSLMLAASLATLLPARNSGLLKIGAIGLALAIISRSIKGDIGQHEE